MSSSPSTPPHQPTYNVRLSTDRIHKIIRMIFPQFAIVNVEQLESGKSYNNRIYFVDIEPASPSPGLEDTPRSLVLKIAGHFFDHRKVENELGCLLLLKKYCPDVPVPEAIAWSPNGEKIETVEGRSIEAAKDTPFSDHAWILTTRLSGRVLNVADLDSEHGGTILNQLGKFITMWRTRIPESPSWEICESSLVPKQQLPFSGISSQAKSSPSTPLCCTASPGRTRRRTIRSRRTTNSHD